MKSTRGFGWLALVAVTLLGGTNVSGQIVINELVDDERTAGSGQIRPDTREYVELYNAGASAVNISGWNLNVIQIGLVPQAPATATYTIPALTPAIAPGDYFVIAKTGSTVANVDLAVAGLIPQGAGTFELFPEDAAGGGTNTPTGNFVLELRNGSTLVDALATETFRDPEDTTLTAEQVAQVGIGYWGQTLSMNAGTLNPLPQSIGRWRDGRDTNFNGRDFGFMPITPGTTNNVLPQNPAHTIPDVDAMFPETALDTQYYASFVVPRVADPSNPDGIVSVETFPASPQGGNAIIAYDETGGGNSAYSKELVNKFDLYAFIETNTLNVADGHEASIYGIGTTDPFFGTPNSAGLNTLTSTQNGSTGVGWLIQRSNRDFGAGVETRTVLQLVHFDDGGDSLPADNDWTIIEEILLPANQRTWHRLSVEYESDTGEVTAKHDTDTYTFNIQAPAGDENGDGIVDAADYVALKKFGLPTTDFDTNFGSTGTGVELLGTFYAGYRENHANNTTEARPPTYDMIGGGGASGTVPEPGSIVLVAMALAGLATQKRRGR